MSVIGAVTDRCVTTIVFNRSNALNATNPAVRARLQQPFDAFAAAQEQRVALAHRTSKRRYAPRKAGPSSPHSRRARI